MTTTTTISTAATTATTMVFVCHSSCRCVPNFSKTGWLGGRPWKPCERYNLVVVGVWGRRFFEGFGRNFVEFCLRKHKFALSCIRKTLNLVNSCWESNGKHYISLYVAKTHLFSLKLINLPLLSLKKLSITCHLMLVPFSTG
jgi:hypothetical protein